jgi:hypothetical protein
MSHISPMHTAKIGFIIALFMTLLSVMYSETLTPEKSAPQVLSALIDSLELANPVLLDIRCGEWTPVLEREMRRLLLLRKVDIREISTGLLSDNANLLLPEKDTGSEMNGAMLLQSLGLVQADILELTLEQSVETGEKRNLISYSKYKMPVYKFVLKQIELPGQRLVTLKEYRLEGNPEVENPGSLLAMKWYEPVLAGAILGSLVYMLWNLK